jgi:hypothetical protein
MVAEAWSTGLPFLEVRTMRLLAALLLSLPLAAAAQVAPPPEVPPSAPAAQAAPPAQPSPPAPAAPAAQPAQPSPPPAYPPVYAPPPPRRDPWYIGFGIGSGGGEFATPSGTFKLSDVAPSPTTVFLNFKVGVTLTPSLLLGFDGTAIRSQGDVPTIIGTVSHAIQISNYDAMLTWFPMERGFFLRGGLGLTRLTEELSNATASVNGANIDVGAGYAFWMGRTFNLTLNLDFSAQRYNSNDGPSSSNFTAIWLGFDWY